MPQDAEKGNKDSLACLQILFSHLAPVPSMAETSWELGGRDPRGCSSPNYRTDKSQGQIRVYTGSQPGNPDIYGALL